MLKFKKCLSANLIILFIAFLVIAKRRIRSGIPEWETLIYLIEAKK